MGASAGNDEDRKVEKSFSEESNYINGKDLGIFQCNVGGNLHD